MSGTNPKPAYQPWNHEEFNADRKVRNMGSQARKCYVMLLHEAFYCSTRPYLPDDDGELWALADCDSLEEWMQYRDRVRAMFTPVVIDGVALLANKRVMRDWERLREIRDQNRANAGKRWHKEKGSEHATAMRPHASVSKDGEIECDRNATACDRNAKTDFAMQVSKKERKKERKEEKSGAISGEMVAAAFLDRFALRGMHLAVALSGIASGLLETLSADEALSAMVGAWEAYKKAIPDLVWTHSGPQKFFESDLWRDPKLWPWRQDKRPASQPAAGRYVDLSDERYSLAAGNAGTGGGE